MSDASSSRRDFLKASSAAAAGAAFVPLAASQAAPEDTSKILNHNAKMTYRPLGKTGFMISEIALGGHGGKSVEDRVPVLEKAVELGLNYVDNNIDGECDLYSGACPAGKACRRWPKRKRPDATSGSSASLPGRKKSRRITKTS